MYGSKDANKKLYEGQTTKFSSPILTQVSNEVIYNYHMHAETHGVASFSLHTYFLLYVYLYMYELQATSACTLGFSPHGTRTCNFLLQFKLYLYTKFRVPAETTFFTRADNCT